MAKKLMVLALFVGLAAWAQHGRMGGGMPGGMPAGGPTSGVGPGMGNDRGIGSDRGMSGDRGSMGNASTRSGAKSPEVLLDQNTKLSSKLSGMLPKGTTPQEACSGFKNLGQCVAAIHVSHNLGIPFDELKAKMTGKGAVSLGRAIQQLDPKANPKAEAKKGRKQANDDLAQTKG